jgi:hypothetical protein
MLGFVEKVNPNYYPIPLQPPREITPGHKFFDRIVDGYLTKEDFATLYDGSVEDAPGTTKPVDHLQVFDKLERIMTTVKIKSDPVPVVATSEQATPTAPASNPQQ